MVGVAEPRRYTLRTRLSECRRTAQCLSGRKLAVAPAAAVVTVAVVAAEVEARAKAVARVEAKVD